MPKVLPVLDLLRGHVVRGVAGERGQYRPIQSRLVDSSLPIEVARAFHNHFDFSHFYLADLDAILGGLPSIDLYRELQTAGYQLWVDAGVRDTVDAHPLMEAEVDSLVLGLETLASPAIVEQLCCQLGSGRLVFSLDLKEGRSLARSADWPTEPYDIAQRAISLGIRRMIVLDLACVGVGGGIGSVELCRKLRAAYPALELTTGGGVRGPADLEALRDLGIDFALVASALHEGRLSRADVCEESIQ